MEIEQLGADVESGTGRGDIVAGSGSKPKCFALAMGAGCAALVALIVIVGGGIGIIAGVASAAADDAAKSGGGGVGVSPRNGSGPGAQPTPAPFQYVPCVGAGCGTCQAFFVGQANMAYMRNPRYLYVAIVISQGGDPPSNVDLYCEALDPKMAGKSFDPTATCLLPSPCATNPVDPNGCQEIHACMQACCTGTSTYVAPSSPTSAPTLAACNGIVGCDTCDEFLVWNMNGFLSGNGNALMIAGAAQVEATSPGDHHICEALDVTKAGMAFSMSETCVVHTTYGTAGYDACVQACCTGTSTYVASAAPTSAPTLAACNGIVGCDTCDEFLVWNMNGFLSGNGNALMIAGAAQVEATSPGDHHICEALDVTKAGMAFSMSETCVVHTTYGTAGYDACVQACCTGTSTYVASAAPTAPPTLAACNGIVDCGTCSDFFMSRAMIGMPSYLTFAILISAGGNPPNNLDEYCEVRFILLSIIKLSGSSLTCILRSIEHTAYPGAGRTALGVGISPRKRLPQRRESASELLRRVLRPPRDDGGAGCAVHCSAEHQRITNQGADDDGANASADAVSDERASFCSSIRERLVSVRERRRMRRADVLHRGHRLHRLRDVSDY